MKKTIKILFSFLFAFILFSIGKGVDANSTYVNDGYIEMQSDAIIVVGCMGIIRNNPFFYNDI